MGGAKSSVLSGMLDCYEVLGVTSDATQEQIQRSFRQLAKQYHPDRNTHRPEWAAAMMTRLLHAYRTLTDDTNRLFHDKRRKLYRNRGRDYYRDTLQRGKDPESAATLILYDLLTENGANAARTYEYSALRFESFDISDWLSEKDWLDAKFLLAEQYEREAHYEIALRFYEEVYHSEGSEQRYRGFREEIGERIRNLCCRELVRNAHPQMAINYLKRALRVDLDEEQRAFVHKKMAECHHQSGDDSSARESLRQAFRIKPDLKGATSICQKLGISAAV